MKTTLFAALLLAGAAAVAPASAATTTVNFSLDNSGTPLASGSFSFDSSKVGVIGYDDLLSFSFTLPTATYDLAFVNSGGFSPYRYFGYDVGAQQFVSADIAGYPQILSAIKDDYASGFFVRADGPILFRDYGPGGSEVAFTNVTISTGVVPEPSAWGLMIVGFGAVGSAMRRRATARAVAA